MNFLRASLVAGLSGLCVLVSSVNAQVPPGTKPKPPEGFEIRRWAREPMLRSPVALAFDDQGRLYVVETARRSTVDIDIRAHPSWVVDDLANQSVDDLRAFFRSRMSAENSLLNADWLKDLNQDGIHDWRDLTMVKEKVHLLEDTTGKGVADRATVFAEGFNEEINGVMAGVMPWGGDVLATVYPDLWRLRDADGDGVAERREIVFRGFGVHAAFDGHDLHGLTVGPEGKIYFSVGDNGFSVTNREGRRLHYPNTGGVLRMNADGSDLEVYATGLRNPQEVAFDELGNLFAVDNDGDLADERERFVFIAEGSDSGWRLHWQFREAGWAKYTRQPDYNPWIDERMWVPHFPGQPAHITPPLSNYSVGPGSFRFNPGTALNDSYRGYFFLIQFPVAKVTAFQARPRGAGFEMVNEHTFVSGMMASAINFSPDGALFIGDWDGMWSPSGKGSIWRVDDPLAAGSEMRREVREWLRTGPSGRTVEDLERTLGHQDMRLRQRSQFELVRRGEFDRLRRISAATTRPWLARVHALWGLGQGKAVGAADTLPFGDADPRIRGQCAKVAGDLRLKDAVPALVRLLADPEATVRFHAALALGKVGDPSALEGLTRMLAADGGADAFLRHAGVMGLAGIASPEALAGLAAHETPAVRVAAVVALRRLGSTAVTRFLSDVDPVVRHEAVRAIHDDTSISGALPTLAGILDRFDGQREPGMVRRALNANLRLGTAEAATRLADYAAEASHPEALRLEAVECLGDWSRKQAIDRVQGLVRPLGERSPELSNQVLLARFGDLVRAGGKTSLAALVRIVMDHRIPVDPAPISEWGMSEDQPATVRARVLELLAQSGSERFGKALKASLESDQAELRLTARRWQSVRFPEAFMDRVAVGFDGWPLADRQEALRLAGGLRGDRAKTWLEARLEDGIAGRMSRDLALDLAEAAAVRTEAPVRDKRERFEAVIAGAGPWGRHQSALYGGDPERGRDIFKSHANGQCVRCHEAGGEGQQVGPVLKGIAARVDRDYLLQSLLDPSARIAEGFATTSVTLRDGDQLDGVRVGETDTELALRLPNGEVRRLNRTSIVSQATSAVSAMPPMGDVLTRFEIRDLVAYLSTLK